MVGEFEYEDDHDEQEHKRSEVLFSVTPSCFDISGAERAIPKTITLEVKARTNRPARQMKENNTLIARRAGGPSQIPVYLHTHKTNMLKQRRNPWVWSRMGSLQQTRKHHTVYVACDLGLLHMDWLSSEDATAIT